MSGYNVHRLVRRRLLISHKIDIVLTDLETQELGETDCPMVCDLIEKLTDEELYALVMKIRKKKKVIAGVC
jgi:hypothetical protein